MQLMLTGLNNLEQKKSIKPEPEKMYTVLNVKYCAICRTDAKMWNEGHRDLVFPRIPGHELVGVNESGRRFTVWPGQQCGSCRYCLTGRENLCEEMKILGFHDNGGFSDWIKVPDKSLIPIPDAVASHIACFTEPVGCVLNAFEKLNLKEKERVIIYGGGTLGLISALCCLDAGATPLIIERKEEKIHHIKPFLEHTEIKCKKETTESEFDAAINACPDPIAFSLSMTKLGKGGRFSFFSGLSKNEKIETNLLHLIHYKETALYGAYGLKRKNMVDAMEILLRHGTAFEYLIEEIVSPEKASDLMPEVLSGKPLKYILNFSSETAEKNQHIQKSPLHVSEIKDRVSSPSTKRFLSESYQMFFDNITQVDKNLLPMAQSKIDNKTKPLGALGLIEDLAVQVSLIQNNLNPKIEKKALFVFAGDHGITEEGVSAFPSEVTSQMVQNFLDGGAAINVFCQHHKIDIKIVDMGVKSDFEDHPLLIKKKVRNGTRNFAIQDAMTREEAILSIENGMQCFLSLNEQKPIDIIGLGEMGIGNTTAAASIISVVTGITPADATGRGTGVDNKGLEHKIEVIENALNFHQPNPIDGMDILCKVGGYEIGGIVGAVLAATSTGTAVVLDGVISTAAGLIAYVLNPHVRDYFISGHKSVEVAQKSALDHMGIKPVLDFGMRLGEGTGAALTMDVVDAACKIMCEMASFDEAGVSGKKSKNGKGN